VYLLIDRGRCVLVKEAEVKGGRDSAAVVLLFDHRGNVSERKRSIWLLIGGKRRCASHSCVCFVMSEPIMYYGYFH
jgi:hypothetical protein